MHNQLREQLKELAKHDEPTVLDPNGSIAVELNGEPWKTGTVQEIADFFDIDLSFYDFPPEGDPTATLTREAFESTLQGLSVAGRIEIKLGHKKEVAK